MTTARLSRAIVAAVLTGLVAATSACGSDDGNSGAASSASASASAGSPAGAAGSTSAAAPAAPFGPGCAGLPADGPGSLAAMATVPVGTAVSQDPLTTALTEAVLAANLVDVLNTRQDITVLAPVDTAFQAIEPGALSALLGDTPRLTTVLTHHVINGRLAPDQLVGEHTTLNGDTVTIAGSSTDLTVAADQTLAGAGPATVVCGDVPTANATVYLIDQVLAPPAAG
ncbi:Uncaracterized surface protein containing fasciclin (FAS1) repeats [Modestobacter sp. DSM 44400]|uniref:fasciclin domain-containing protein n=1 Tax=Modestobacter sp. DSM 44400 TaxID=1550230 RepID=UPI00089C255F|nr:fasciclin domain-containing protein [Modestobacter sp. DSM 44400]SDY25830.1 Uncaracterized surface protein containing fasciclin (FAS1) repeats [Modestobacter sp. DSM 44400]